MTNPTEKIKEIEKEIEGAKQIKFRNCLVCEKKYSLKQSDTKRYCSRKCSDIAMRVRDWENKRGMNLRILQAKLQVYKEWEEREKEILEMIDELLEESKRLKEYGWIDGVELKTNLQEKFK